MSRIPNRMIEKERYGAEAKHRFGLQHPAFGSSPRWSGAFRCGDGSFSKELFHNRLQQYPSCGLLAAIRASVRLSSPFATLLALIGGIGGLTLGVLGYPHKATSVWTNPNFPWQLAGYANRYNRWFRSLFYPLFKNIKL